MAREKVGVGVGTVLVGEAERMSVDGEVGLAETGAVVAGSGVNVGDGPLEQAPKNSAETIIRRMRRGMTKGYVVRD